MQKIDWDDVTNKIDEFLTKNEIKYPECGFHIGPGWLPVVFATLTEMIDAGWNKDLHQVKEKFCGLRIYIGEADGEIYDIIHEAERKCSTMCESCGKPHGLKIPKTGMAACERCK